jgi:hypothetical protein
VLDDPCVQSGFHQAHSAPSCAHNILSTYISIQPIPYHPCHFLKFFPLQESIIYADSLSFRPFFPPFFNGRGDTSSRRNLVVGCYGCLFLSSLSPSSGLLVTAAARLQCVAVARCSEDCACVFLATYEGVLYPRVGEHFVHGRALARVELEHAADDVPGLTREQAEETHGTLDRALFGV